MNPHAHFVRCPPRGLSTLAAAGRALLQHTDLAPADIVKKSLEIAGDLCIYTNQHHTVETL